jgi:hypothetical protein
MNVKPRKRPQRQAVATDVQIESAHRVTGHRHRQERGKAMSSVRRACSTLSR